MIGRPKSRIQRARSAEEYVDWVRQAIFEVEELRLSMEYDMDSMGGAAGFVDRLESDLRALLGQMEAGSYAFANEDLPFMEIVERVDERLLPFGYLLSQINATHREGLDTGEG